MANEIRNMTFAGEDSTVVTTIVNSLADLAAAACNKHFKGLIEDIGMSDADYKANNEKVKTSMLKFACSKAGVEVNSVEDMYFANDNLVFRSVLNTIETRAIAAMMVAYDNPMISAFTSIETIAPGNSRSFEIEPKALPIAQRGTYGSNITQVPSYARGAVTVTPKVYCEGVSLDFIRLLANGYDWGLATARVYAGMIYAQYALAVNKVFDANILAGTPLYQASFTLPTYVQLASDVGMLNGGAEDDVIALGTRPAFNGISATATNGGFMTKDEYIRGGYLKEICNVNSVVLDQFTNLAAPFTTANAASLRAIPNGYIVLVARGKDNVVKLVRENYIRAIEVPAHDNTLNRMEYMYFQAFDAAIATSSFFGVQATGVN